MKAQKSRESSRRGGQRGGRFAQAFELGDETLKITRLQSDLADAEIDMAVERSNAGRELGELVDPAHLLFVGVARPVRGRFDQGNLRRYLASRRRDLDRERLIRGHRALADRGVEAPGDTVQGVSRDGQLLGGAGVLKVKVGARLQRSVEPLRDQSFVGCAAVEFKTKLLESGCLQPVMDDVERGHFFGDEKHRFAGMGGGGDDVGNCLRFAGAGRPVHNEIASRAHGFDDAGLRGIGVDHMDEIGRFENRVEFDVVRKQRRLAG
jgi:hypothetical protein